MAIFDVVLLLEVEVVVGSSVRCKGSSVLWKPLSSVVEAVVCCVWWFGCVVPVCCAVRCSVSVTVAVVVVVVVVVLLWVQGVELVMFVAPPPCPGLFWGKLPLSPLTTQAVGCLEEEEQSLSQLLQLLHQQLGRALLKMSKRRER